MIPYLLILAVAWTAAPVDRSPVDVAVSTNEQWLVTTNETSSSVSLIQVGNRRVVDELTVGPAPAAAVWLPAEMALVVSCAGDGSLRRLDVRDARLVESGKITLDGEPRGIAVTASGRSAYVALERAAEVVEVDLAAWRETRRIGVGRWPRTLALSPDGSRLAVGTSGDQSISIVDTAAGKMLFQQRVGAINIGQLQASLDGQHVYFPWMVYRHNPITPENIRKGWVLGSRIARVRLDETARREAVTLDPPGQAVADPYGLALSRDERRLVVTAAGTHELLVFGMPKLRFVAYGGPGDHIERDLLADRENFVRIPLGGRPLGVCLSNDGRTAWVANWLSNAVQVVDLDRRQIAGTIDLGRAHEPSLARRGAALFYDGTRSLDQWYSCHSCHYNSGPNSEPMDTKNDGSAGTFKTVPTLFGTTDTGPWTWHGWQTSLGDAVRVSYTETMLGPAPSADETRAVVAFLAELRDVKSSSPPSADPAAIERGRAIFVGAKANCASCHRPPHWTDGEIHDVGTGSPRDKYSGYNTPSLRDVSRRVKLLHDGRARSLDELLTGPHEPSRVAGTASLTADERRDLIAFLETL